MLGSWVSHPPPWSPAQSHVTPGNLSQPRRSTCSPPKGSCSRLQTSAQAFLCVWNICPICPYTVNTCLSFGISAEMTLAQEGFWDPSHGLLHGPAMHSHSLRACGHSTHHCPITSPSLVCPHRCSLPSPGSRRSITLVDSTKERTSERVSWPLRRPRPSYSHSRGAWKVRTCCYLQFSPGVELLQAVHGLLSVHAGGHGGPVLKGVGERSVSGRQALPPPPEYPMDVAAILGE